MRYPSLVKERVCKTNITVNIYSQRTGEDGEPITLFSKELKCNYNSNKAGHRYDEKRNIIELHAIAYFSGDVFPEIDEITNGDVFVYGQRHMIYKGTKARNPDGTVNYTCLELI